MNLTRESTKIANTMHLTREETRTKSLCRAIDSILRLMTVWRITG